MTDTTQSTQVERDSTHAETVAGLRALADLLEANPHLANPFPIASPLHCYLGWRVEDKKAAMASWARAATGFPRDKSYDNHGYAELDIDFGGGVTVKVYTEREEVCERVVKGVREVTKTVKDPAALAAVPDVEVTVTEEDVEWICHSLLGGAE